MLKWAVRGAIRYQNAQLLQEIDRFSLQDGETETSRETEMREEAGQSRHTLAQNCDSHLETTTSPSLSPSSPAALAATSAVAPPTVPSAVSAAPAATAPSTVSAPPAMAPGRLELQRSDIDIQIQKELRLRAGAENLLRATSDRKRREMISQELGFVNRKLQNLKEKLADLNTRQPACQPSRDCEKLPNIPLGLKETKDVDFRTPIQNFISDHYKEACWPHEEAIRRLRDLRQACRSPPRSDQGLALLYQYYNSLHFVDRRFFSPAKSLGIIFEWYDSLTGAPSCQRSVAFERGGFLFNIAALLSQIAARQDRNCAAGLERSIECFCRAAGAFKFLAENFARSPPSFDSRPRTLLMLQTLMLSQAQELIFEKYQLQNSEAQPLAPCKLAQEAASVSILYRHTRELMVSMKSSVPVVWRAMVDAKTHFYQSVSHFQAALGATCAEEARAHLRQAAILVEKSILFISHNEQLRITDNILIIVHKFHALCLSYYSSLEIEDDFTELVSVSSIPAVTDCPAHSFAFDPARYSVEDFFKGLGPMSAFNATSICSAPRLIQLMRLDGEEYGFSVRGDSPVIVAHVESGSLAAMQGLHPGDILVSVNDIDIKWKQHPQVVQMIRDSNEDLQIVVVTPIVNSESVTSSLSSTSSESDYPFATAKPSPQFERRCSIRVTPNWIKQRPRSRSHDAHRLFKIVA